MNEKNRDKTMKSIVELVEELYPGKEYSDVFEYYNYSDDELEQHLMMLRRKKKFRDENNKRVEQVIERKREVNEKDFMDMWRELWNDNIVGQTVMGEIYGLTCCSQLFKHIEFNHRISEDLRLHPCIIMPSGFGKSEGNDMLAKFARECELNYILMEKFTDAALTGSIDQKVIELNSKNKLKPGDPNYIDPYVKSPLEEYNFIIFDEGEAALKPTRGNEISQRILQKAMNRMGSDGNMITNTMVSNKLAGKKIETRPSCSIIITSYYLDEFKETLLNRGLLQRMIVYIREEDRNMRTKIIDHVIDNIPVADSGSTSDIRRVEDEYIKMKNKKEQMIKELGIEALKLRDYHQRNTKSVILDTGVPAKVKEAIYELREIVPFQLGQEQIWESIMSRLSVNLLKVAAIYALIDYRNIITAEDIAQASKLLNTTMRSVAFYLAENVKTVADRRVDEIYIRLKAAMKGKVLPEKQWTAYLQEKYHMSENSALNIIRVLEKDKKIKSIIKDGQKIMRLEDKR